MSLSQRVQQLPSGKVLDVSNLLPNGTGARAIDKPKTDRSSKRMIRDLPVVSDNYTSYKLAMDMLGPAYASYANDYQNGSFTPMSPQVPSLPKSSLPQPPLPLPKPFSPLPKSSLPQAPLPLPQAPLPLPKPFIPLPQAPLPLPKSSLPLPKSSLPQPPLPLPKSSLPQPPLPLPKAFIPLPQAPLPSVPVSKPSSHPEKLTLNNKYNLRHFKIPKSFVFDYFTNNGVTYTLYDSKSIDPLLTNDFPLWDKMNEKYDDSDFKNFYRYDGVGNYKTREFMSSTNDKYHVEMYQGKMGLGFFFLLWEFAINKIWYFTIGSLSDNMLTISKLSDNISFTGVNISSDSRYLLLESLRDKVLIDVDEVKKLNNSNIFVIDRLSNKVPRNDALIRHLKFENYPANVLSKMFLINGQYYIAAHEYDVGEIRVYDIEGKIVNKIQSREYYFNLSDKGYIINDDVYDILTSQKIHTVEDYSNVMAMYFIKYSNNMVNYGIQNVMDINPKSCDKISLTDAGDLSIITKVPGLNLCERIFDNIIIPLIFIGDNKVEKYNSPVNNPIFFMIFPYN